MHQLIYPKSSRSFRQQFLFLPTMSNNNNNNEMQDTENADEWINWIEDAISKNHMKFYEYTAVACIPLKRLIIDTYRYRVV